MEAEVKCKFTRDANQLIQALDDISASNVASLEDALNLTSDYVVEEWSSLTCCSILLITDLTDCFHDYSIKKLANKIKENQKIFRDFFKIVGKDVDEKLPVDPILNQDIFNIPGLEVLKKNIKYPFSFPNSFNVICLCDEGETCANELDGNQKFFEFDDDSFREKIWSPMRTNKSHYLKEIVSLNNPKGKLFQTKSLKIDTIANEFCPSVAKCLFSPFKSILKCGSLRSNIKIIPSPLPYIG